MLLLLLQLFSPALPFPNIALLQEALQVLLPLLVWGVKELEVQGRQGAPWRGWS